MAQLWIEVSYKLIIPEGTATIIGNPDTTLTYEKLRTFPKREPVQSKTLLFTIQANEFFHIVTHRTQ